MTREQHLAWAKERALEYLAAGDTSAAVASLISDLGKHEETRTLSLDDFAAGAEAALSGEVEQVRQWLERFH